ncbi:MAG: excinuclease ABC subunit UvrA [Chlamydiales bacterium]|nr:excinuclease ABC subunit UvrA [Chlamydiales bacterium]
MQGREIVLKKVRVHNLKGVDLTLEPYQLIIFTGVSGSGKSSLAFDTIYVEGQRRYIESLSAYARRHLADYPKPDAELIEGISPTIAIEQKTSGRNPRSTVGTITGIYDYLRVLFARVGTPHCPVSLEPVKPRSAKEIASEILALPKGTKLHIFSPYARGKKGEFKDDFAELLRHGFTRVRLDGRIVDLNEEISLDGKIAHDIDILIDRLVVDPSETGRLEEAIAQALEKGKGVMSVQNAETQEETLFSQLAFSPKSGLSYGPLSPQDFSFNHPSGMCPTCMGLGTHLEFKLDKIIDPEKSINEDCCSVASSYQTVRFGNIYDNLARLYSFKVNTPWKKLSEKAKNVFLYGSEQKWLRMRFVHPTKHTTWTDYVQWRGVLHEAKVRYLEAKSDTYRRNMEELMEETICPDCHGARIKPYPAATTIGKKRISELTSLSVEEVLTFFQKLSLTAEQKFIADELLKEIIKRLQFLYGVGLHYLTLERTAPTLSGGEAQRVRLASQIGSGLVGATYILDEPSIGLHPRDNLKLLASLKALRDKGNTVIVVEHDEETIREADHIVDVGPEAGERGGEIVSNGSFADLLKAPHSLTGAYLSGRRTIAIPKKRRTSTKKALVIEKATHHNLKSVTAEIPLGVFVAVTGVSGSGKSSLITDLLYPALSNKLLASTLPVGKHKKITGIEELDKVIAIDQSPIGRTPRSNPATYVKLFDEIRKLFSELPESQASGFGPGRFSFNVQEGSCPHCGGMGMTRIDMDFMEDEWVTCIYCAGRRFDEKTLSVLLRGKNIHDVLEMTVAEALDFFSALPAIRKKLETLNAVGLDYLKIGQPSPTLSGGEAQRIKLAKELSRPSNERTLYILDEPTTGLHFHDLNKLIGVLQALVDRGSSLLVIEHNMDLIKCADWIIDLGPEGGKEGGEIVATGTPEKIAKLKSPTGVALNQMLSASHAAVKKQKARAATSSPFILVEGASQNNLKSVNAKIPREKITLCTGPSGSGKSSFAFETVYAEGQRRYVESLSTFSRQFVSQMPKPKVDNIEGLSPAIAIEQSGHGKNPRSTVGTMTEVYDYLRLLFAHLGTPYSPETGKEIRSISKEYVTEKLLKLPAGTAFRLLAPIKQRKNESWEALQARLLSSGYLRVRLNNTYYELDENIPFDKHRKNSIELVIDRLKTADSIRGRLLEAIEKAASLSGGIIVAALDSEDLFFNLSFADVSTGKSYPPITPHTFSFNTDAGMCLDCLGLGVQYGADLMRYKEFAKLTPLGLAYLLWKDYATDEAIDLFRAFLKEEKIDARKRLDEQPSDKLQILLSGSEKEIRLERKGPLFRWRGISPVFAKAAKSAARAVREEIAPLLDQSPCHSCKGSRLNPLARNVRIGKLSIADLCNLPIESAESFISEITLTDKARNFLEEPLRQIGKRLHFLKTIGLGYLSLDRTAPTLSGGEEQRIRLSRQLGSGLTGCIYVLDEPTVGLHPHDNEKLNSALIQLRDLGNTLILVEHDPMTMAIADEILDFGPGAGKEGGEIIAQGTLKQIKADPRSLTGAYLSGRKKIAIPEKRRKPKRWISIENASLHNLHNVSVEIPVGIFSCITGVSGSGKSTLIGDLLRPAASEALSQRKAEVTLAHGKVEGLDAFEKLVVLDQNPLGQTSRADVSTYSDLLTPLRYFFADLQLAKARGLQPRHFSFNHKKGMCTSCWGLGTKSIQLQFLPPVKIVCDSCNGYRLNPVSLQVTYRGKQLGEILNMTVSELKAWEIPLTKVSRLLDLLISVGLGYLKLNQEVTTLSGGEAQRLRLSRELAKRSSGKTLYLLDEPTTGLHSDDIAKLLPIFQTLVDKGNTLIVIEHNLDIIANADYLIEIGPEAGEKGGKIVATCTPEELATKKNSLTGRYLAQNMSI